MSITLDARAVFVPPERFKNPEALSHTPLARISRVRPGQVMLKHSYETPITKDTQFIIEGTMAAKGGAGGANISGTIKHQFSPKCWAQVRNLKVASSHCSTHKQHCSRISAR